MSDRRAPVPSTGRRPVRDLLSRWEAILVLIFVGVIVLNSVASPYFLNPTNLLDTTFGFVEKGLLALPMTLGIIMGDIDISVAGIIALSSLVMGALSSAGAGTAALVAAGLGTGFVAGLLNGLLATRFGIPMIAVTIGGISLFRGIAYAALGDQAYTKYPESFAFLGQGYIPGTHIPFELLLFVLFAAVFAVLLHGTTFGRRVYAIGNNPVAARFSGVRVQRMRLAVSCITGTMAGVAGVLLTSRIGSTRPNIASGWEMEAITTVVLGGVAISGGKGNISGVILGIFLLGFLRFGMSLVNIPSNVQSIISGVLLIVAILLPEYVAGRQRRALLLKTQGREG
jgi:rhamnose transport system permease protein